MNDNLDYSSMFLVYLVIFALLLYAIWPEIADLWNWLINLL
jgi:hypothetical protein